jgi:hypothetical protein
MDVSTDYSLDLNVNSTAENFKIESDTVIKTIEVAIRYQTKEHGMFWGETIKQHSAVNKFTYPANPSQVLTDEVLFEKLKDSCKLEKIALQLQREAVELISSISFEKYPLLQKVICTEIILELRAEDLMMIIPVIVPYLPDDYSIKAELLSLMNYPCNSPEFQAIIKTIRQKLDQTAPAELFQDMHQTFIKAAPLILQNLEKKIEEQNELAKTLQLPIHSQEVQKLIVPLRAELLQKKRQEAGEKGRCQKWQRRVAHFLQALRSGWQGAHRRSHS